MAVGWGECCVHGGGGLDGGGTASPLGGLDGGGTEHHSVRGWGWMLCGRGGHTQRKILPPEIPPGWPGEGWWGHSESRCRWPDGGSKAIPGAQPGTHGQRWPNIGGDRQGYTPPAWARFWVTFLGFCELELGRWRTNRTLHPQIFACAAGAPTAALGTAGRGMPFLPPPPEMSAAGSKYIDTEVENAINGVKQMKTLMDKTSKDHQAILHTLEETKRRKEVSEDEEGGTQSPWAEHIRRAGGMPCPGVRVSREQGGGCPRGWTRMPCRRRCSWPGRRSSSWRRSRRCATRRCWRFGRSASPASSTPACASTPARAAAARGWWGGR